ncbi:MAG: redoxin domain-containing protein, partial [Bacteroidales bacterium]|nr:redoxin domain-containing protein [Bacteroidales bacterium]
YDPNSPLRDEEMYLPLCRILSESPLQDSLHRAKYAKETAKCSLNRIGTRAADFTFSDKNGRVYSLYGIKADWTLLFFSNPGCHACKDIIETLKAMEGLDQRIAEGKLAILNIYIDEDMSGWYEYMPYYPENWYNGYDQNLSIRSDQLYDVRAIPSLYLLDKDKKVVLKDAPEERMYHQLSSLL